MKLKCLPDDFQVTELTGRQPLGRGPFALYRLTKQSLGTPEADARLARVLWNDPATGVMRHADAGYEDAVRCTREQRLNLPMIANASA